MEFSKIIVSIEKPNHPVVGALMANLIMTWKLVVRNSMLPTLLICTPLERLLLSKYQKNNGSYHSQWCTQSRLIETCSDSYIKMYFLHSIIVNRRINLYLGNHRRQDFRQSWSNLHWTISFAVAAPNRPHEALLNIWIHLSAFLYRSTCC